MDDFIPFLPEQASTFAEQVDTLYFVLIGLSSTITIVIVALIVYFGIKYRRRSVADRSNPVTTSLKLELAWMGGLLILALITFTWSARLYFHMYRPPSDTLDIYVVGKQWMWKFQHPSGQREINELHVPVNRPIKLIMSSEDVIHSFYVPAFRVKHDVIPGTFVTAWFEATQVGEYHLFCAEYCGALHAGMIGRVIVMDQRDYQVWLSAGGAAAGPPAGASLAEAGEELFQNLGCSSCHRMDDSGVGPPLAGLFGQPVPLESGEIVIADEAYIRESIYFPQEKIVAGYPPVMPAYEGQISEEEMLQLVAYITSLADADTDTSETTEGGPGAETTPATQTTPGVRSGPDAQATPETQTTPGSGGT